MPLTDPDRPVSEDEALRDGWGSVTRCDRCGGYCDSDDAAEADGGLVCVPCAEALAGWE